MLILLPASERKTPVTHGKPFEPARLSFPSLAPTRAAVLDALAEVSAGPDASRRLDVPRQPDRPRPCERDAWRGTGRARRDRVRRPAVRRARAWPTSTPASRRRAQAWIVVISALWGAVRLGDRIPPYRLNMCGRLPGLAHLPDVWRGPLAGVLPAAAGRGLVVDCRSAEYATAWRPAGELAERTVVVKLRASSHDAKYLRGRLARRIVTDALDPQQPEELANALSEHFKVDLLSPARPGRSWELRVIEALD